jgi:hypothetical protein
VLVVRPGGLEAHHEAGGARDRHRISRSAAAHRRGHVLHVVAWHAVARELEHDAIIAGARAGLDSAEHRGRDARPDRSCSVNRRRRAGEAGILRCGWNGKGGAARGSLSRLVATTRDEGAHEQGDPDCYGAWCHRGLLHRHRIPGTPGDAAAGYIPVRPDYQSGG